ncbi:MAG: phosphoribosylanthranilate isomerase [Clostridia bacterium]
MTKLKLCGLVRICDIEAVNRLNPEYIGFVFAKKSRRYVDPAQARELRARLDKGISPVGVFVNESPEAIADLVRSGIIDVVQLHGSEDEDFLRKLRELVSCPIIKAFSVKTPQDVRIACESSADLILLDSGGGGTGTVFDWDLLEPIRRPWFLAGGLSPENAADAIRRLAPYGVDVSSGIETDGVKDIQKMNDFVRAVRGAAERKL